MFNALPSVKKTAKIAEPSHSVDPARRAGFSWVLNFCDYNRLVAIIMAGQLTWNVEAGK
jgi:hypothetical protein